MTPDCPHARIAIELIDQAVGVYCVDCTASVAACWMDRHISESLWNRACEIDPQGNGPIPCDQNRDDVCAICHESTTEKP